MHTRWLVVVAAAGACVPVPPFRGEPQQPALLDVDKVTGEVASTTSAPIQYGIKFAGQGVRMPEEIRIAGVNVVRGNMTCGLESGVGINLYPAFSVSAPALGGNDKVGATDMFAVDWAGPVIARVAVTWSTGYSCNGAAQDARGVSTFTMFPNGRIVRHDRATPSTTALAIDGRDCGCSNDDNFNFSSFWSFQPALQNVLPDGTPWSDGASALGCAVYSDHTVGVGFSDPANARLFTLGGSSAFDYDWVRQGTTLEVGERETTTAIVLSTERQASRCGAVTSDLADPTMTIGTATEIGTDDNGIYQGPARQTEPYQISSPVGLPRGFAVSLDLGAVPVVERNPPVAGDWYATQVEGDRVLVWFRDGLAATETITIDPR